MTAKTRQLPVGQDNQDWTTAVGQLGQDNWDRTTRTGQLGLVNLDRRVLTGQRGQNYGDMTGQR